MLAPDIWPPSALTVAVGDLTLAPASPDSAAELVRRTRGPATVFADPAVPWAFPWLSGSAADSAGHLLRQAASLGAPDWNLGLIAHVGGEVAGAIDLRVTVLGGRRVLETGSYLLTRFQGRGLGTSMRRAALALAFDRVGARELFSGAHPGNAASIAVSRRCGYVRASDGGDGAGGPARWWRVTPGTADYGGERITVTGWTPALADLLPPP